MNRPPHLTPGRSVWAGLLAVGALVWAALGGVSSNAAPATPSAQLSAGTLRPPTAITLVTGEVLSVRSLNDGTLAVTHDGDGPDASAFLQFSDAAGDVHVVPGRLIPMLPDRLDPRLFNVSALLRDGYGVAADGTGRGLPLMITYTAGPVSVPGVIVRRELPSINGAAVSLISEPGDLLGQALLAAGPDQFIPGVEKIWLDGPMAASLDESVPQIGAPAAWEQGYDGTGVRIAVVDTGIDDRHPDLAGRVVAAEVFSDADSPIDVFGHGTHVASIAAGNGAASDGQFTGVAYGADLVNAKVLDDFGSGLESWVIAGMEWSAIDQDADIVNMSINGGPTDGTDLVSQAVNTLSAAENALFVTSAGNFGGYPESLETPSTAEAALAVGAVDKSDVLAWFSAWGPRIDGTGVKPEIVAPGVDITAARAEGSELGPPVGENYMELSGTSMATPHVAGAAALLLEANPSWTWAQLKSALVTSAVDVGSGVFQQGGGRVDVPSALAQTVHSDLATVDLGVLEYPHDDGETSTAEVTLTNDGDTDVTLDLATEAVNENGEVAPPEMITAEPATLDLPAGGSDVVTLTFDPQTGPIGLFGGTLVASVGGLEALQVPLSFKKEPQLVDLTVEVLEREGADDLSGLVNIQNVDDVDTFFEQYEVYVGAQTITTRVPLGHYAVSLMSFQFTGFADIEVVTVTEPEMEIVADTAMTLDSNDTTEVEIDVGEDVTPADTTAGLYRASEVGDFGVSISFGASGADSTRVFVNETDSVTLGAFEYYTKVTLDGAETRYDLIFPEPDAVPADLSYEVGPADVAHITNEFHADVERTYYEGRLFLRPWSDFAFVGLGQQAAPTVRMDWVTADDTQWAEIVDIGGAEAFATMEEELTTYEPAEERVQSWVESPMRPWFPVGMGPRRFDDTLQFFVPPWSDQDNHVGYDYFPFEGPGVDTFRLVVSADGEELGEVATPYGEFQLPAEPAEVEVTLEGARDAPWWSHSTQTSTTWRFVSEPSKGEPVTQPLYEVDYDIALDLYNETDSPNPIGFRAYGPDGSPPAAFTAWWSIDDGEAWEPLVLADLGDGAYESTVPVPASCDPSCDVSLRVTADDTARTVLEQEIIRAYTARYVAPSEPPTEPPTTTPIPTTTLPDTGAGDAGMIAGIGVGVLLLGGLALVLARRRLTKED